MMDEMIKEWLKQLYENEIEDSRVNIENELLWALGYDGEEPNPHTENIERLYAYIDILRKKINELK